MMKQLLGATAALALMSAPALADTIKIGFVTTLTTGAAIIGVDQKKAVDLAVEHMGGKMGSLDVEIVYEDTSSTRKRASRRPKSWSRPAISTSSPVICGPMCCWPRRRLRLMPIRS